MPFRSPKMYSFIFGFQRFVWWPKCTPASSRSFIAIPGNSSSFSLTFWRPVKRRPRLAFTELEALARASQPVLLAFLDARIRRHRAVLLHLLAQLRVVFDERAENCEPHRAGLAVDTAAIDGREDVELVTGLREEQRAAH